MELQEAIRKRRSVRKFLDKPVPIDLIKKILQTGSHAPTSCNQQLWKFVAITDQKLKERLVKEAASSTIIRRAPVAVVVCYDGWDYKEAIQSGSFAGQNILLTATEEGIGVLPMNSFGNEEKIKEILGIPENYRINCFILLGYPEKIETDAKPVPRRPIEEMLTFNQFKEEFPVHRSYDPKKWTQRQLADFQKYWCRKTFLGKKMDILDDKELQLVKRKLHETIEPKESVIDYFSYDGSYLELFPEEKITSVNLEEETRSYTQAAVQQYAPEKLPNVETVVFGSEGKKKHSVATLIFKRERLSPDLAKKMYTNMHKELMRDGKLLIIARKKNILFSLFYSTLKWAFGDDVRKTGIYAFWGPYAPVRKKDIMHELKQEGFVVKKVETFYSVPPFFNQVLQMGLQYIKSGGTTYLHRDKHNNILVRMLEFLINKQPQNSISGGSVLVILAQVGKNHAEKEH